MIKIILIIMAVFILYCMIETARELRDFRLTKYRNLFAEVKWNQGDKEDHILSDLHNRMYGKENEQLTGKHQKPTSGPDPDRRGYVGSERWENSYDGRYAS